MAPRLLQPLYAPSPRTEFVEGEEQSQHAGRQPPAAPTSWHPRCEASNSPPTNANQHTGSHSHHHTTQSRIRPRKAHRSSPRPYPPPRQDILKGDQPASPHTTTTPAPRPTDVTHHQPMEALAHSPCGCCTVTPTTEGCTAPPPEYTHCGRLKKGKLWPPTHPQPRTSLMPPPSRLPPTLHTPPCTPPPPTPGITPHAEC